MILKGTKTATRRNWKKRMVRKGGVYKCKLQMLSKDYFAKIIVTKVYQQDLIDMSFEDIKKEGYETAEEFDEVFRKINKIKGHLDTDIRVWVIEFKVVEDNTSHKTRKMKKQRFIKAEKLSTSGKKE